MRKPKAEDKQIEGEEPMRRGPEPEEWHPMMGGGCGVKPEPEKEEVKATEPDA